MTSQYVKANRDHEFEEGESLRYQINGETEYGRVMKTEGDDIFLRLERGFLRRFTLQRIPDMETPGVSIETIEIMDIVDQGGTND